MRFKVLKYLAPASVSRESSTLGMGYVSLRVTAFILLKSTQKRVEPSFFWANTTGEAQGLCNGWITSFSSIPFSKSLSSPLQNCGILRGDWWIGGDSPVSMECLIIPVCPRSSGPLANKLLYWSKSAYRCSCSCLVSLFPNLLTVSHRLCRCSSSGSRSSIAAMVAIVHILLPSLLANIMCLVLWRHQYVISKENDWKSITDTVYMHQYWPIPITDPIIS